MKNIQNQTMPDKNKTIFIVYDWGKDNQIVGAFFNKINAAQAANKNNYLEIKEVYIEDWEDNN